MPRRLRPPAIPLCAGEGLSERLQDYALQADANGRECDMDARAEFAAEASDLREAAKIVAEYKWHPKPTADGAYVILYRDGSYAIDGWFDGEWNEGGEHEDSIRAVWLLPIDPAAKAEGTASSNSGPSDG